MEVAARVRIEKLLNNGCGLARLESGLVVMVPGALPGEIYAVETISKNKGVTWAEHYRRLEDASFRREPLCDHYPSCGGCRLLHLERERELELKLDYLSDVLERVGGLKHPSIEAHDFALESSRIRGKLSFANHLLGFRSACSNVVQPIPQCLVIPDQVRTLLPEVQERAIAAGFSGDIYFATDATGRNPVLEFHGKLAPPHKAEHFLKHMPTGGSIFREKGKPRVFRFGRSRIRHRWNDLEVDLEPSQFVQSNPSSWPIFFRWVREFCGRRRLERVWDMYAGAGFLASAVDAGSLLCSEPEPRAWPYLQQGLTAAGFSVTLFRGTAEAALRETSFSDKTLDGLILDPPRQGLSKRVRAWIRERGPADLLYFSCDLASFARDLRDLTALYRPDSPILVMNLAPGTLKLETAIMLSRKKS